MHAATVDQRLAEPLNLLAEIGAHESPDGHIGPLFAELPEQLGLTLVVAELPSGASGRFDQRSCTLTVAESVIDEDPRVVAVVLVHELQHALDAKRTDLGLLDVNCVAMEVRGFTAQAAVTRLFWPDELPSGTPVERSLTAVVRSMEEEGTAAVAARLAASPEYRGSCAI
jgi:hypothetical protein